MVLLASCPLINKFFFGVEANHRHEANWRSSFKPVHSSFYFEIQFFFAKITEGVCKHCQAWIHFQHDQNSSILTDVQPSHHNLFLNYMTLLTTTKTKNQLDRLKVSVKM